MQGLLGRQGVEAACQKVELKPHGGSLAEFGMMRGPGSLPAAATEAQSHRGGPPQRFWPGWLTAGPSKFPFGRLLK